MLVQVGVSLLSLNSSVAACAVDDAAPDAVLASLWSRCDPAATLTLSGRQRRPRMGLADSGWWPR